MRKINWFACCVVILISTLAVEARIISYAPISDRHVLPAVQHRTNRFFLLIESPRATPTFLPGNLPPREGELVLYDSTGATEPKVLLLPSSPPKVSFIEAALFEVAGQTRLILAATREQKDGESPAMVTRLSTDDGQTWRQLDLGANATIASAYSIGDIGGPVARDRGAQVKLGTTEWPFVAATAISGQGARAIHAISREGNVRLLVRDLGTADSGIRLLGSNGNGSEFLFLGTPAEPIGSSRGVYKLTLDGQVTKVAAVSSNSPYAVLSGWIAEDGSVYVDEVQGSTHAIAHYRGETRRILVTATFGWNDAQRLSVFAVPSHDYRTAWIIQRATGSPTILSRDDGQSMTEQWRDISAPEVEALHTARSGERLLIQVHRPRPAMDQRVFQDPALAIWTIGAPAPARYDELFLIEGPLKGFVNLDVDAVARGSSFTFDSAATTACSCPPPQISAGGGGADVTQEWGTVRASLQQRLVIPGVARLPGAYGSNWRTDVILQNASAEALPLEMRFVPRIGPEITLQTALDKWEIRSVPDILGSTFGVVEGGGTLYLTPPLGRSVVATARTYNVSEAGTFGMGLGAIELTAASSSRFPLSFAGAFPGMNFRTNLIVTDATARGAKAMVEARGVNGKIGHDFTLEVAAGSETQFNSIAGALQIGPWESGSLLFRPSYGEAIASVIVIDNRTNDPTYFPPDLPANVMRTIPVIGHVDGANGSKFRTDLYLYNPSDTVRSVTLSARAFDSAGERTFNYTLLPRESRIIPDVLHTAFNMTGLARLRFISGNLTESNSVRVTSRTYNVDANGGTYGFVMPPLNSFQTVGPGESLEIIGATADPQFRVNIGIVDAAAWPAGVSHRVKVETIGNEGAVLDSFETSVPSAGGIQLLDVLRGRSIALDGQAVMFRISPSGGLIGTFTTFIDNRTNDAVLLTSGLSAKD